MHEFSKTKVISSLKTQNKECDSCKAIEVIKHKSCTSLCLGDSIREQLLVAEKISKSLKSPLSSILSKVFTASHPDFSQRIAVLESNIENLTHISEELPQVARKISSIAPNFEVSRKVKLIEERLNRIEDVLNTRAAEIFDLKERVQGLEMPRDDGAPIGDLTVYKEEIKKQGKILDDRKWGNDQMKLDIIKLKKEKISNKPKLVKEIEDELKGVKNKNANIEKQIERLEVLQKSVAERTRLESTNLESLQNSVSIMVNEQRNLECLNADDLVRITKSVFSSYRAMKRSEEFTKSSIRSCLDQLKNYPALLPHISEIEQEINHGP